MIVSFFTCRSIFKSPISTDNLWLEIPVDRTEVEGHASEKLVSEVLIVQKRGYYLEWIKENMPHIEHLLKPKIPNLPCADALKQRTYPLLFLAESQDLIDQLFENERIRNFFLDKELIKRVLTVHMTDQQLYNKFPYQMKSQIDIKMDDKDETIVKNILFIADTISRLKVKHAVSSATKLRREKIYTRVRRAKKVEKEE